MLAFVMTCVLVPGALYILRNEHGDVLMSAWGNILHCPDAASARAIAGLNAMQSILSYYSAPLQLESDYAAIVSELNFEINGKSSISSVVRDIKEVRRSLPNVKFRKVNRSGNGVAHELGRMGRGIFSKQMSLGSIPDCRTGVN